MKKIKLIFLFVILVVISLIILNNVFFISNSKLNDFQTNDSDLKFVHFGSCYFDKNSSLDLSELLQKDNKSLQQVYVQIGEILYFSYQYVENDNVHWCIASIKSDGSNFEMICDEIFNSESLHKFKINLFEDYKNRNGYYYNNKIVLTDFSKVVEYNIESEEKAVCDYINYQHPTESFYYNIENHKKIIIIKNNQTRILTISDLIEKNNVAKTVFEKYNNKTINGMNACEYFFDNIQFINGHIYIICRIHRWDGCAYALVFKYDFQTTNIEYLGGHYTNDLVRRFYLIDTKQDIT